MHSIDKARRKRGRPEKWGHTQRMVLVGEIAMVRSATGCTARSACRALAETSHWSAFLASGNNPRKRQTRLQQSDPSAALWEQLKATNTSNQVLDDLLGHWGELLDRAPSLEWSLIVYSVLGCSVEDNWRQPIA